MPPPGASENASRSDVGDHSTEEIWSSSAVTWCGQPPWAETVHTWGRPDSEVTKARRSPSGEKDGEPADPTRAIASTSARRSVFESCGKASPGNARSEPESSICRSRAKKLNRMARLRSFDLVELEYNLAFSGRPSQLRALLKQNNQAVNEGLPSFLDLCSAHTCDVGLSPVCHRVVDHGQKRRAGNHQQDCGNDDKGNQISIGTKRLRFFHQR